MSEQAATPQPMVRAMFRAVSVPGNAPHNVLSTKIYYPAVYGATPAEINTGAVPAARGSKPCPVAILMPGINVSPESYAWLATALVNAGFVAVLYGWINEEMPGMVALSPGLDIDALKPGRYGQHASATALAPLLSDLAAQNQSGPLAGLMDLDRVLLGGHSAGGSVALFNANPKWFPGVRAAFAYGAHSKASTLLGYEPDTFLKLPDALPLLVLGGSQDGVIAASAFRYGDEGSTKPDATTPVTQTFERAIGSTRGDCYLAIISGANHFSMASPADPATGRPFLDWAITRPEPAIRQDLGDLVCSFARAHVADDAAAQAQLRTLLDDRTRVAVSAIR